MSGINEVQWLHRAISVHWKAYTRVCTNKMFDKKEPFPHISENRWTLTMKFWGSGHNYSNSSIQEISLAILVSWPNICLNFEKKKKKREEVAWLALYQTTNQGLESALLREKMMLYEHDHDSVNMFFFFCLQQHPSFLLNKQGKENNRKDKRPKRRQRETSNVQNTHPSAFWGRGGDPWSCQVWRSGGRRLACCQLSRSVLEPQ